MFDTLTVEVELPDGRKPNVYGFQTKSLENILANYKITPYGRLFVRIYDLVYKGEYDPGWTKDGETIPRFEEENERWEDTNYHGIIIFYPANGEWVDYKATFTNGQLITIEVIE